MGNQTLHISGNVGSDAELKYTKEGVAVASFNVAVSKGRESKTTWFRVTVWKELAEVCAQYVRKGMGIACSGSVSASAWIDKQGNIPRASLELTAYQVDFWGRGSGDGDREHSYDPPPRNMDDVPF